MALFELFKTKCTKMVKARVPDGEGGWTVGWAEGGGFRAAIVLDSSTNARIAEAEGVTGLYTVTADKGTGLGFHDAFRRDSDGKTFRVTKVNNPTPSMASFQFDQCQAEEWELT